MKKIEKQIEKLCFDIENGNVSKQLAKDSIRTIQTQSIEKFGQGSDNHSNIHESLMFCNSLISQYFN
jgi:hypothetical protein